METKPEKGKPKYQSYRVKRDWVYAQKLEELPEFEVFEIGFSAFNLYSSNALEKNIPIIINKLAKEGPGLQNTIYDPRLGFSGSGEACSTCNLIGEQCAGHFGFIELAQPIISPIHIRTVVKVLSCVCRGCGELILSEMEIRDLQLNYVDPSGRLDVIVEASKGKKCHKTEGEIGKRCVDIIPYIFGIKASDLEQGIIVYKEQYEKNGKLKIINASIPMPVKDVANLIDIITDSQAEIMGFDVAHGAHPRNAILNYLIVIPPCSRTNNIVNGRIKKDMLGKQYENIIKTNNLLSEHKKEKNQTKIEEDYKKLYGHISGIISNTEGSVHLQNVSNIIKGKKGLMRNKIFGFRVDYSGRTVASNNPELSFWQVGIPEIMARELTFPVMITTQNRLQLNSLLKQGKIVSFEPGPKSIFKEFHGHKKRVDQKIIDSYRLTPGDIVHRWLQDGDWILLNRQPTIHKYGIMGFEVLILPPGQKTIQTNVMITKAFNLDYDGDELNIHIPQTKEAQEEARTIMSILHNIRGGDKNKIYIALTHKSLHTIADMTRDSPESIISPNTLLDVGIFIPIDKRISWSNRLLTVNSTISRKWLYFLFNENINLIEDYVLDQKSELEETVYNLLSEALKQFKNTQNKTSKDYENMVSLFLKYQIIPPDPGANTPVGLSLIIFADQDNNITGKQFFGIVLPEDFPYYNDGKVIIKDAMLIKGVITASVISTISDKIYILYGREYYAIFLEEIFKVLNSWGRLNALTVGIKDCRLTNPNSKFVISNRIQEIGTEVTEMRKRLTGNPEEDARLKRKIVESLSSFASTGTKIISEEPPGNNLIELYKSGAKGTIANLNKITGGSGQIFTQGGFPECKISGGQRHTFYQAFGDNSLEWGGFCTGNLMEGLDPISMVYLSLAGIEGLLKGQTKTPDSGNIFRQLRIFLQSIIIHPDGSVRDEKENIIQSSYGNNGGDPTKTVWLSLGRIKKQFFTYVTDLADKINFHYKGKTRILTSAEIKNIAMKFEVKSCYLSSQIIETDNLRKETSKILTKIKLNPLAINQFSESLTTAYNTGIIPINQRAGSSASEALTGDITQDALDGKKNTGTSKYKIAPLDTFKEIVSVTQYSKDPKTRVYLKPKIKKEKKKEKKEEKKGKEKIKKKKEEKKKKKKKERKGKIGFNEIKAKETELVSLTLQTLILDHSEIETPDIFLDSNPHSWYETFEKIYETKRPESSWMVRFTLKVELIYKYKVTPTQIRNKIKHQGQDIFMSIISPVIVEKGILVMYLDLFPLEDKILKLSKKLRLGKKITKFELSTLTYSFLNNIFLPQIDKIVITGAENIRFLEIEKIELDSGIETETLVGEAEAGKANRWRLYRNWGWINYNFEESKFLERVCKKNNIKILKSESDYVEVEASEKPSLIIERNYKNKLMSATAHSRKQDEFKNELFQKGREIDSKRISLKPEFVNSGEDTLFRSYYGTLEGENLGRLFLFNFLDTNKTFSYNIIEMYTFFGISVARNLIVIRLVEVFKSVPIWIDPKHLLLLADFMCFTGKVNKIGKYGSEERGSSIIQTASLGYQMAVLAKASYFGNVDPVRSVASSIFVGKGIQKYPTEKDVEEAKEDFSVDAITDFLENLGESAFINDGNKDQSIASLIPEETEKEEEIKAKLPEKVLPAFMTGPVVEELTQNLITNCVIEENEEIKEK